MSVPAVVIAAPSSGSGKTTVATGLVGALRRAGRTDYCSDLIRQFSPYPLYRPDQLALPLPSRLMRISLLHLQLEQIVRVRVDPGVNGGGKTSHGAAQKPTTSGDRELMPGLGVARLGTRAPRIAGVCQGALA